MAFDAARYEREVIGPLRGRRGGLPDMDPRVRYGIDAGMGQREIEEQLRKVRAFWNQKATGAAAHPATKVCRQLLAADDEQKRVVGGRMATREYWDEESAAYAKRAKTAMTALVDELRTAYGGVGLVLRTRLSAIANQKGIPLGEVEAAAGQAKLRVVDPVKLPAESGLDRTAFKSLTDNLAVVGLPTIVQLLHPGLARPFTLTGGFAVSGGSERLDAAAVTAQITAAERAADSPSVRARKAALGVLRTALGQGSDLGQVALFQVAEQLRLSRVDGVPDNIIVGNAVALGMTKQDADLLVSSLPAGTAPVSPATRLRELLAEGRLRTAQQQLASIPAGDGEADELRRLLADADGKVVALLAEADRALAGAAEADAERALRQALALATDDDEITARIRRLPPPPPRDLRVTTEADTSLRWSPPLTGIGGLRYRVVRALDRPPASPQDGVLVGETAETTVVDPGALVARRFGYAVFAAGEAQVWSRAAETTVTVIPPVRDVTVKATQSQVVVSWQVHPAVVSVRVRRTSGRPPSSATEGYPIKASTASFTDTDITERVEYYYSLVAVYHDERLGEVAAEMVLVSAAPRLTARAVENLVVEPIEGSGAQHRVRISWTPQPSVDVRIRRSDAVPSWQVGTELPVTAVGAFGTEVAGAVVTTDNRCVLETEVPAGFHVYVPFAIGGNGAVVGRHVAQGLAAPMRQLRAERLGDRVVLSWVWPDGVGIAEVTWQADGGAQQTTRITRNQYFAESGCRLDVGAVGGDVAVVAVTVGPLGEARSPVLRQPVPGRTGRLAYTVERLPGLRQRWSPQRVLRVTAETACHIDHLVVVARQGQVMPLRAAQGEEIHRWSDLDLGTGEVREFTIDLPAAFRRPYWIRCFVEPPQGVTLTDPPIDQLKV
ncbi:hypothetical protein F4553_006406 [Allocatelliglobosispora scoriae]|uniref:Fibronectin type-III domain-containing protein n=1 Tax=Allocatelliglobosispora scoriae TaxID=643052 RepID=A0A841C1N4_9ACTN|nr:hypothetical protein [Allocatelliglobosispora scoriae]MBB5872972.1 hypothetical protein [Allocatelliglobosispora scoriae]